MKGKLAASWSIFIVIALSLKKIDNLCNHCISEKKQSFKRRNLPKDTKIEFFYYYLSNVGSFILIFWTQHCLVLGEAGTRVKWKSGCNRVSLNRVSDALVHINIATTRFLATVAVWLLTQDRLYRIWFERVKVLSPSFAFSIKRFK